MNIYKKGPHSYLAVSDAQSRSPTFIRNKMLGSEQASTLAGPRNPRRPTKSARAFRKIPGLGFILL